MTPLLKAAWSNGCDSESRRSSSLPSSGRSRNRRSAWAAKRGEASPVRLELVACSERRALEVEPEQLGQVATGDSVQVVVDDPGQLREEARQQQSIHRGNRDVLEQAPDVAVRRGVGGEPDERDLGEQVDIRASCSSWSRQSTCSRTGLLVRWTIESRTTPTLLEPAVERDLDHHLFAGHRIPAISDDRTATNLGAEILHRPGQWLERRQGLSMPLGLGDRGRARLAPTGAHLPLRFAGKNGRKDNLQPSLCPGREVA